MFLDSVVFWVFWVFWDLLLVLSSFCHPFGGRDSLRKRKIRQVINAKVPGLGQITEITRQIELTQKLRGHSGEKLYEHREIDATWTVGVWVPWAWWQIFTIVSQWNQIQTLKDCLCCYIYCVQLGTSWNAVVQASRAVSDIESRCPLWSTLVCSWGLHELHTVFRQSSHTGKSSRGIQQLLYGIRLAPQMVAVHWLMLKSFLLLWNKTWSTSPSCSLWNASMVCTCRTRWIMAVLPMTQFLSRNRELCSGLRTSVGPQCNLVCSWKIDVWTCTGLFGGLQANEKTKDKTRENGI